MSKEFPKKLLPQGRQKKAQKTKLELQHIPASASDAELEAFAKKIREGQKAYDDANASDDNKQ